MLTTIRRTLPHVRFHAEQLWRDARRQAASLGPLAAAGLLAGATSARLRGPAAAGPDRRPLWPAHVPGYRHPVYFRPDSTDPNVLEGVLGGREYECVSREPGVETIVDCGGNIGLTTFYLLHHYPKARAVVVEPDAGNLRVARKTLAPFADRVAFVQAGVWPTAAGLVVERGGYRDGGEWAFQVRPASPDEPADFLGVPLPALMRAFGFARIDLLKIDIEAAEADLFAPAGRPAEWLPDVGTLAIELHDATCQAVVGAAVAPFRPAVQTAGELTIYRFPRPPAGA